MTLTEASGATAPDTTEPAIELRGLGKAYGGNRVLSDVDLAVPRGTILGYIGPNGAGKSTTVKILVGMIAEFDGEARVCGLDVREERAEVRARIGYVPENAVFYEALTVAETLLFIGRLQRLDDDTIRERGEAYLDAFELLDRLDERIGALSKGMRQKVLVTAALLHDPEVLFVDEPLSGLDVNASLLMKELLRALADEGRTIFYCSHVMDVVERVCDRIAIVHDGGIAAQGTYAELSESIRGGSLERIFANVTQGGGERERVEALLERLGRTSRDDGPTT